MADADLLNLVLFLPLAGIALRLQLKVLDVRPATPDEIEAGSVDSEAVTVMTSARGGSPLH